MHEVLKLIEERVRTGSQPGHRADGHRIVLSVEGGGMRGTVSAGMALALHELGLVSAFDAGVAESIPFRTPHAQGATHILILRSRRPLALGAPVPHANGSPAPRPPRSIRLLARTTLRKESLALRTALLTRPLRTAADMARIALLEAEGKAFMIFPPASVPPVSRLTTDAHLLAAALESGRATVRALLAP